MIGRVLCNKASLSFYKFMLPRYRLFLFVFLVFLIQISACSTVSKQTKPIVWPKPPAEPRVIYELTLRNQSSLSVKQNEERLREIATGISSSDVQSLLKPYDVAAFGGLVVVSDSLMSSVHVFDVPRKKLFQMGWRGQGKLRKPLGVAIDSSQNIYVADAGLGRVVKFDKRGHFISFIGEQGDLSRISDVAVDDINNKIYVLDRGGVESVDHQVLVYSIAGVRLGTIGKRGHKPGYFNHPNQLAVNSHGELFVLDAGNFRVQIFNSKGEYVRSWGKLGNQLGNLARPRGIALDAESNVYVTDGAYQNFQIFNSHGQLLLNIGSGGGQDLPGNFLLPAGIAIDETNRIYVVDQIRRKVDVLRLLQQ